MQQVNQIANYALVEWIDNIGISDPDPAEYWPAEVAKKPHLGAERLVRQRYRHALPHSGRPVTRLPVTRIPSRSSRSANSESDALEPLCSTRMASPAQPGPGVP